ncbi:insulysin [Exophiala aquamarina CBS 119918]|uniref:Insulysin n=1 Tax=Exophiala aquamarina CBS 119918 TaxID=1182545 RepID=A0A072P5K9_9EURO|nr:insulysin [Exophiala aquamarina CBS 119918]KEF50900.1 insulysin [Exophiala aquamarina CBS 119918]
MKTMAEVDFRFRQQSPVSQFTSDTSSVMPKRLPRNWLLSTSKFRKFDATAIIQALQYFREDNLTLMLVSQDYPGTWNLKEKWYGTEYTIDRIPTDVLSDIRKALNSQDPRACGKPPITAKRRFEVSGLLFSISANMLGVDISVHGYNDKMAVLLEKILITM